MLIKGGGPQFGLRPTGKDKNEERNYQQIKDTVMKELDRHFRPEFIGRLDDVIVFRPLGREHLEKIVELELNKVMKRLTEHGLKIDLTNEAKEFLIKKGTNTDFGARPLRRAIELDQKNAVALSAMAEREFRAGRAFEARAFSERRLSAAPADARSLQLASQIEEKLGDSTAAAKYVQRLRAEFPDTRASGTGDEGKQ